MRLISARTRLWAASRFALSRCFSAEPPQLYCVPAVPPPTENEMKAMAEKHHFNISEEDLKDYQKNVTKFLDTYHQLELLPEPGLPAAYPSNPGYVPSQKDNPLNAWTRITDTKGAPTGKLAGKTVCIKENIAMAGVPMTISSMFLRGYVSPYHATVVRRILEAGGFIRGKAAAEGMCFSGSSYTSFPAPVLNPIDKERSSGGSSSGSGALVANGDVDLSVGTDTGGSVRLPASWCGIVAHKPTYGLVPHTGILGIDRVLDNAGPMTRTVKDCALLLEVIAGYDGGLDPVQPPNLTVPNYSELLTGKIAGTRIALIKEGFDDCEPGVAETVREAAKKFESLGAKLEEISFPSHLTANIPGMILINEGGYETYTNGGLTPISFRGYKDTITHDFMFTANKTYADDFPISVKAFYLSVGFIREKYGYHFYAKAMNIVRDITADFDKLFEKFDLLVMPTIKYKAPKLPLAGSSVDVLLNAHLKMATNCLPYNVTGNPALSVNAGFSDGFPIGLQIVGRRFEDAAVLNAGYAFENIRDAKK